MKQEAFWVTNISTTKVTLDDLGVSIAPLTSVNLLDKRHYHLTAEQVNKSAESGSLFVKKQRVVPRKTAPSMCQKSKIAIAQDTVIPSRQRSTVEVKNVRYEELDLSPDDKEIQKKLDEQIASDNAALDEPETTVTTKKKR